MKTFKQFSEGFFSKKSEEDPAETELADLGMKAAGKSGWSKKEQERYNDLWLTLHKKGKTPAMPPPAVHGDDSWGTKTKKLHKKLRLTVKDHPNVMEKVDWEVYDTPYGGRHGKEFDKRLPWKKEKDKYEKSKSLKKQKK